jgi:hypothetical protein
VLPMRCKTDKSAACGRGRLGVEWLSRRSYTSSVQSVKNSGSGHAWRRLSRASDFDMWLSAGLVQKIEELVANRALQPTRERLALFPQGCAARG